MEIVNEQLPWSTEDESHWLAFLQTPTGGRLLPKLAEQAPQLLDGGHVNRVLIRSGELRGFQSAIQILLSLSHAPPRLDINNNNYPAPEDDRAWNDGQKLNPS